MDSEQRSRNQTGTPKTNRRDPKSAEKKQANEDRKIIDRKICHFSVNDFSVFSRLTRKEIWKLAVFFDIGQEFRATDAVFDDASGVFANGQIVEVVHCRVSEI